MANAKEAANRPLSPHLQIYKPIFTMVMSIVHRITGAALYFGLVLLVWWLLAAATSPSYFELVNDLYGSIIGRIVLLGLTWALMHHALGGIRHFIQDTGRGLDKSSRNMLAYATLAGSLLLTLVVWVAAYMVRGG